MTLEEQVRKCQTPKRQSYAQAWARYERLTARGFKQVYCRTCKRWKWPQDLCKHAVVDPEREDGE